MEFDTLLKHFDENAGQKEQIGLVIYYLEVQENQSNIAQSDTKEVIQQSRSPITLSSVPTYISRLKDTGWIKPTENGGYRLTHTGKREVEDLLDDKALNNPRNEEDLFIDFDDFEDGDDHYEKLVGDINQCYKYRIYDATMVLTRKFFEDLVFQILKIHYAGKDNEMFYDQENGQHYSFDDLLSNLEDGVPTLRQYSRELDRQLVNNLRDLKDEGNSGAHGVRVDFTDEEVESWTADATRIADVLYEVLLGARIRDEQGD